MQAAHVDELEAARRELERTTSRLEACQQGLLHLITEVEELEYSSQQHDEAQRTLQDQVSSLQFALRTAQVTWPT